MVSVFEKLKLLIFFMKKVFLLLSTIYCLLVCSIHSQGQLLNDATAKNQSLQALDYIYNFKFKEAGIIIGQIKQKYPKHPAIPFLKAMTLYWRYVPLTQNSDKFPEFDKYMDETISKAEVILNKDKQNIEGIYFKMLGYSLKSMLESEEGSFMKSVSYGKKAFHYMKKGFEKTGVYPDFHFSTGLYRYYAEQYPDTHPIAKPVMVFFPYGNKKQGLNHLAQAANSAQFSKTEAKFWLCQIYAKYEQNYSLATY